MSDYKVAKEAFVSDNAGGSIFSINVVSFTALVAYALYAIASHRFRPHPVLDFGTTVLPLLIAVTSASTRPITFSLVLVLLTAALRGTTRRPQRSLRLNGFVPLEGKSKGRWLDESDSDEEPSVPTSSSSPSNGAYVKLPSEVVPTASTTALSPALTPIDPSPTLSPASSGSRRRRHSPTPSTYTHTAIDVLPTPELSVTTFPTNTSKSYPSAVGRKTARSGERLPFLSVYRAHMMVMTIHCILAVDFPVFPRWQGKCEDFGTSLMDIGVGSFVFSLGIVSGRSFTRLSALHGPKGTLFSVLTALRKAAPVLLLGVLRVLMVKGSDYPEHVTEYGVHWNFFFTLGLLPAIGALLFAIRTKTRWAIVGMSMTGVHQLILGITRLQLWTLSAPRTGLISQNKEGLVSLPGYFAIYALGLAAGEHILRSRASSKQKLSEDEAKRHLEKRRTELALELFGYAVAWWVALAIWRVLGGEVSRRLANLPYVLWVAAYNTTFLLAYLVIDLLLSPSPPVPPLLEAINANGRAIFLVANVFTGLVNLSIKTMYADDVASMIVLVGYSAAVCTIAWFTRGFRLNL